MRAQIRALKRRAEAREAAGAGWRLRDGVEEEAELAEGIGDGTGLGTLDAAVSMQDVLARGRTAMATGPMTRETGAEMVWPVL